MAREWAYGLKYRSSRHRTQAVYRFEIDLWATSNLFKKGHRLRLDVSSSEFPLYELNPNTGTRITHDSSGHVVKADQTIYHDDAHRSRLILPRHPRQPA